MAGGRSPVRYGDRTDGAVRLHRNHQATYTDREPNLLSGLQSDYETDRGYKSTAHGDTSGGGWAEGGAVGT